MTPGARIAAAIEILDDIIDGAPAERALTGWARGSRFAGSKDRAAVRDFVFDALRAKRSLAASGGAMTGRALLIALARRDGLDIPALFNGVGHAPAPLEPHEKIPQPVADGPVACDIPDWLWPQWCDSLGGDAETTARALQSRADVYLRVNNLCGRDSDTITALAQDGITVAPHPSVLGCLRVLDNARRIKMSAAYQNGLVELQDAASQFAVQQVATGPDLRLLDYCAGGGGKALAFADRADVQVFAHDIDPARMSDIPTRANRAGANVTCLPHDQLSDVAPFDVVFCDAPCSGSGTWRRTPDAKWRLTQDDLIKYQAAQRCVLQDAIGFLAEDGQLVYATCSVLTSENDAIIHDFLNRNQAFQVLSQQQLLPGPDWDGFYICIIGMR